MRLLQCTAANLVKFAAFRSVKLIKSKLAFGLQTLFYSEVEIAGAGKMPIITGVRVLEHFKNLRENHKLVNYALFATELVLKSTADEQPNAELFDYFLDFLNIFRILIK